MKTTKQFREELYAKYGKRLIIPNDAVFIEDVIDNNQLLMDKIYEQNYKINGE